MVDVGVAVERRWRDAKPLRTARHSRIIDRLHINTELNEKPISNPLATQRIADHHRDNVAWIVKMRNAGRVEATAHVRDALLQLVTFSAAGLEMTDAGESTRGHGRRQRRREDEAGGKTPHEIA